ncbi:MAG: Ig-like domain repeat protein [Xanthomonadales bacterium PRO7]|nr:Ig-like domain repeat protein [Xanthomonadales bacterium PRO7]
MKFLVAALGALVLLAVGSASAQNTYSAYVNSDNNAATGCTISLPGGTLVGADLRIQATLTPGAAPTVTGVTAAQCSGGTFGAGTSIGGGSVDLNSGVSGSDSVEFSIPGTGILTGGGQTLAFGFTAESPTGSDVMFTRANGGPIIFGITVPTPALGVGALALLALLVIGVAHRFGRTRWYRHMVALSMVAMCGVALAAAFNWTGIAPVATDPAGDPTNGSSDIDLRAGFVAVNTNTIYFRIDVTDLQTQAPQITSANAATFIVGQAGTFAITSIGVPSAALTLSGCTLPTGVNFVDNGNGTGTLAGTPGPGTANTYSCTLTAANGIPPDATQAFTLTVANAPSQTGLAVDINPSVFAQTVTFTATVTPAPPGSGTPTGTVNFLDGATNIGSGTLNGSGVATFATGTLSVATHPITTQYAGDVNFGPSTSGIVNQVVNQASHTITFTSTAPAGATVGGATYTVTATASSGLTVALTIDASSASVCSLTGSTVSFIGVGNCVIDANQAGDANYTAAPQVQQSFAVAKGNQTITFSSTAPAGAAVGGPTYTVTATASSGLTVTLAIDASSAGVCSLSGSTVSFIGVGTCVIDANQAGNANYNAAPQAQQTFAVAKADQTISFASTPPNPAFVNGGYTVSATASSGLAVTFSAGAPAVCTVSGSTVTFVGAGTCIVNADQAGNANYNAAPQAQQTFTVSRNDQTITFTSPAPATAKNGGATYTVSATASSGLTVTFSSATPGVCTVATNVVTFVGAGTCTIDADQAGNAAYNPAPQVQQSFPVAKGDQTINATSTAPAFGSATASGTPHTYTVVATATSGLAVTVTTAGACSNAGTLVTFGPGAGACTIKIDQGGDTNWNPAPQVQQSTTVEIPASATNDSHDVTGNVAIAAGTSVLSNDAGTSIAIKSYGVNGNEQTTLGSSTGTAQGGLVTLIAAGTYNYDPPANFTGTDTFKYVIGNDLSTTSTGTVTLTVSDRIIVVASGASGNCKPVTPTPCALSFADGLAAPTGKDLVFVQSGNYTNPNATISLNANQILVGNGPTSSLATAIGDANITLAPESVALATINPGTTPSLTNNASVITLGGGNLVEYLAITNTAGSAILGNVAGSGTSNIHDIAVNNTSGNGVNLTANLGTLNFSNLTVVTTTGSAFAATGGGTVNATAGSVPNTLSSTTGTALNVANTTIGASNLTFRSISSNGAGSGIVLNNTGAGRLIVTGDASTNTCKTGTTTCSGGTIQNSTADGVSLTSAKATLALMWIKNNANSGIKGMTVAGFSASDLLIQNNTNAPGEQAGILINDLTDSAAQVTRAEVSGSKEDNVRIHNTNTTGTITFSNCTIIDNDSNPVGAGNQGLFLQTNSTGNLTGTVQNSIFHGNRTIALRADSGDASTVNASFLNNTITAGAPNQGNQGIEVSRAVTSTLVFNITGNTVSGMISTLINVFSSGGPGTATGDVKNNTVIGTGVGGNQYGIRLFNSGSSVVGFGTMNVNVAGNNVSKVDNAYPILGEASGSTGTGGTLKIAVTGNTANVAAGGTGLDSIRLQARNTSSICAQVSGNTTDAGGPGFFGMQVRQANTGVFNLEGLTVGPQVDPTVRNYVISQNPGATTVGATIGTITGVANASCGITP